MPTARRSRTLAAPPERVWEIVGDPHHLPRWWPRVTRVEAVTDEHFTEVLATEDGRSLRADFRVVDSRAPERRAWEQEVEGTPFERSSRPRRTRDQAAARRRRDARDARRAPAAARLGADGRLHGAPGDGARPRRGARGPGGAAWAVNALVGVGRGRARHARCPTRPWPGWRASWDAGRAPRRRRARRRAPGGPAAARRGPRALRRDPARRPRGPRAARARQVLSRPRAPARGRLHGRAGRRPHAARPRRGARGARGMRGRRGRGRALRGRDERRRRPRAAARRLRRPGLARPRARSTSWKTSTSARRWRWWAAGCGSSSSRRGWASAASRSATTRRATST